MATQEKDPMRDLLDQLETPAVRWGLVCIGVVILVRLRLILFAAALPVMAYWHYSNSAKAPEESSAGAGADEDEADGGNDPSTLRGFQSGSAGEDEEELNDPSFWENDGDARKSSPSRQAAPKFGDDDDFGFGAGSAPQARKAKKPFSGASWDDDDTVDDFPKVKVKTNMDDILGSIGSLGPSMPMDGGDDDFGLGKLGGDFDFLGSGGGDDMDFGGFGGGRGKGKGKGKKGDKGDKDKDKGPREANPKQVFVAGIGDAHEDDIRMFFEEVGEVDRLKLLTTPEGDSKGVCFVTFRTEEQAQTALGLHGRDLNGRNITVRLAHGGGKGKEDGDKGGGKGGKDKRDRGPMDLGGGERFGGAFGGDDRGDRPSFGGGGGGKKGGGKGRGRNERSELDELLEEALADADGPVRAGDFDFAARRFLSELRSKDRSDSTTRFQEAMDHVIKYTNSKDRSSVRKWPAYVFTLLQKFDPRLWEELRERDATRKAEKGGGGGLSRGEGGFTRGRNDDDD